MTWRQLSCGACGGPRTALDDAMFIACEFCGALYDASAARWFDPRQQTEAFARAHAAAFWGSTAAGRFTRLGSELAKSTPTSDADPEFLARSEEYHYIYTLLYPDRVPVSVTRTAAARVAWAKQVASTDAVVRVDPQIAALMNAIDLRAFGRADASAGEIVAAAQHAVAAATRAYTALQSHPRLVGQYPAPAAHYARMTVRMSLLTMLGTLRDPDIYERVAVDVFGDRHGVGEECTHCGAPLADLDREVERCSHCRSVLERSVDDPWIASRVALFRATLGDRHRRNEIDTYVTALAAFSLVGAWARAGAERCATYLRRAMPWLPADALDMAVRLYPIADAERASFDAAIAAITPWTPDATQRPAPPPPPADAFDPEAWLEKSRVYWGYARGSDPVLDALSIAITDVLVAQPDARPPITAALVLRFFDEVLAHVPHATWSSRLDLAARGYSDTPAGELVRAVAAAVRAR